MQKSLTASMIRGGTSRGLFLALEDLPPAGPQRDSLLTELLGSPDPIQVDGLGGGHSHTSKVMAVGKSDVPDVDVDYLFAQVDVRSEKVDYGGNCGNLTAAVAVYAIDNGLARPAPGPEAVVVLRCLNTDSLVRVTVPVDEAGNALTDGDFEMAGVRRTGARIDVEYLNPSGAMFKKGPFPTGNRIDTVTVGGKRIEVSIVDITSPLVIALASDFGLKAPFVPERLNADPELIDRVEQLRGRCAALLGLVADPSAAAATTPGQPKVALCAPPSDYTTTTGELITRSGIDLLATMVSMGRFHHAFAGTGALSLASASRIQGTVAFDAASPSEGAVRIGHPKGVATAKVNISAGNPTEVESVTVSRTARILMKGEVFYLVRARPD